jgi:hypothetical protein
MICYKDMTFCAESRCLNLECFRNWRNVDQEHYKQWSKEVTESETEPGPVAFCNFEPNCEIKEIEVF